MSDAPTTWMPRERWDALVRGEDCPLCAKVRSTDAVDEHGYTIADLQLSRLRLASNQFVPGYCVLICVAGAAGQPGTWRDDEAVRGHVERVDHRAVTSESLLMAIFQLWFAP
jgi:hypothetical protein